MANSSPISEPPFQVLRHLGEGGYGSVSLVKHDRWGLVAYKRGIGASTDSRISALLKEEAIRHKNLHDSNIVVLYDAVFTSTVCGLFIEYMKYGTVEQFLKEFSVSRGWKTQIMFETASAMSYLHRQEPVIIHGDLSCQNILIGDGFHAKISDFGFSSCSERTLQLFSDKYPTQRKSKLYRSRIFGRIAQKKICEI